MIRNDPPTKIDACTLQGVTVPVHTHRVSSDRRRTAYCTPAAPHTPIDRDITMPYYETFQAAWDKKDAAAVAALFHEDCEWIWHSSGKTMNKETWAGMLPNMFKMHPFEKQRCLYENADICVSHQFAKFPSGDTEAVMMVQKFKDGKVIRVETGSTLVPKDSPNYIADPA